MPKNYRKYLEQVVIGIDMNVVMLVNVVFLKTSMRIWAPFYKTFGQESRILRL